MTSQCLQCGRFKAGKAPDPVKDAMTAQLRAEIPQLKEFDRICVEAVEQELDQLLDEARAKDPNWDGHMWMVA